MTTVKKLGIWMDHSNTHVMEFNPESISTILRSQNLPMNQKRRA